MKPDLLRESVLDSGDINQPLLVIVGPTAVGKTALSLDLARIFSGEIISADSRLLYRGLDIGTDKPDSAERGAVNHHLIDICDPDQTITLGQYQRLANRAIEDVHGRGYLPIMVGGTGQYVRAVVEGWKIPKVPPQLELRHALLDLGEAELWRWLCMLDPESSAKLDPRNTRRVIRALEVTLVNGVPMSSSRGMSPPNYRIEMVGLTCDREILYQRIDGRVDDMMNNGLLEEVSFLKSQGYGRQLSSMSGLGYRQILSYLDGELELEEAVERIKYDTHRFVRQQYNWFRLDDERINWCTVTDSSWRDALVEKIGDWLGIDV